MKIKNYEIDYEGMGTLLEATIKINGKYICTVGSNSTTTNRQTEYVVKLIKECLEKEMLKATPVRGIQDTVK